MGLLVAGLVAGGVVALILAGGGNRRNPGAGGESGGATSGAGEAAARPNIVFVLTDDLDWSLVNRLAGSPACDRARAPGRDFSRYFVADSLCCRDVILTGDFPHDTGVLTNFGPHGGLKAFNQHGE